MRSTCRTQSRDFSAINRQVVVRSQTLDGDMDIAWSIRGDVSVASANGQVAFESR